MVAKKSVSVSFFSIQLLGSKNEVAAVAPSWKETLERWNAQPMNQQKIGDRVYRGVLTLPVPALGIHSPTSGDFRTEINLEEWEISDAPMDDSQGSGHLIADPTAVIFLERASAIAIARSNASAPGSRAVKELADKVMPPPDGARWVIRPIVEPGRLREFRESHGGIDRFAATLTTSSDLLTELAELEAPVGPHALIHQMAKEVQAELKVKIEVSLIEKNSSSKGLRQVAKRFANLIRPSVEPIVSQASKVDVHYLDAANGEVLNLVERKFSVREEITFDDTKPKTFTCLLEEVANIATRQENRVIELMGGNPRAASS